jgi:hypothetical protein
MKPFHKWSNRDLITDYGRLCYRLGLLEVEKGSVLGSEVYLEYCRLVSSVEQQLMMRGKLTEKRSTDDGMSCMYHG